MIYSIIVDSIVLFFFYVHSCWRNKTRSEVTLLNCRQFRRDSSPYSCQAKTELNLNRGSLSLRNCRQFNKVTSERVLFLWFTCFFCPNMSIFVDFGYGWCLYLFRASNQNNVSFYIFLLCFNFIFHAQLLHRGICWMMLPWLGV